MALGPDRRPSRPRRVLRGRRGARESRAARAAADRRRRSAGTRCRRDRELRRTKVRHPLGDELPPRRSAAVRTRSSCDPATRSTASTRARLVDGARHRPDGRADGPRRGISRSRRGRARLPRGARGRRGGADGRSRGTSLTCSLGVAPCKVVAKVGSDARKPGGLTVVVPGAGGVVPRGLDVRRLPGVGPKAQERLRAGGVETVGGLAGARRRRAAAAAPRQRRRGAPRPRARHRSARARPRVGADLDQRREHVRARSQRSAAPARRAARAWRSRSPAICRRPARSRGR